MCGRFALTATPAEFEDVLGVVEIEDFPPRFNIAPTQPIHVVVAGPRREPGSNRPDRVAMLARWGFVPSWVKDTRQFPLLINARSETAAGKSSFRAAMRHRRVLIPASGFYEWKREGTRKSQAYWVRPKTGGLIAFGGLMETYAEPGGSEIDTAAILTTAANSRIAHIHERMPVVIRPGHFREWLDCVRNEPRDVVPLMAPVEEEFFEAIPVSEKVNKVANTGPDVQEPLGPEMLQDARTDEKPRPDEGQLTLF
ncbi:SOS response-associated peptidase [Aquamicrobium sp. LC103]|uniref:SOS response-associated peptidase n=1 Tax=Aquamicrobium sp. LC103 TaxID=1120658 RepID=UPI00063EAD25|nr:SOS response-associated peptidase [Aquamicrobium sp. LC103]TKT81484.1 SOS response-associated peptidase [Aquamicrobium sp. LC103]